MVWNGPIWLVFSKWVGSTTNYNMFGACSDQLPMDFSHRFSDPKAADLWNPSTSRQSDEAAPQRGHPPSYDKVAQV